MIQRFGAQPRLFLEDRGATAPSVTLSRTRLKESRRMKTTPRNPARFGRALALLLALAPLHPLGLDARQDMAQTLQQLRDTGYEVGRALPPSLEGRPLVSFTLEEAISRAIENNLGLQSARINPELQAFTLQVSEAAFRPALTTSMGYNNQSTQSTSQLDGGARITTERNTMNLGLSQLLPWYGARLTTSFNNARTSTDNIFSTRNPSFSSSFSVNYSMPILSGLRIDGQRNALRTQRIQREIVDIQLRAEMENLANQVRTGYWNLRSQIEQIEIQRRNLAQAQQLLENNRVRVRLGTMVEMELAQAEVQVANAEQALLNAEIQWRTQELNFKRLLVGSTSDPLLNQTVNPVDLPIFERRTVDIDGAVSEALEQRNDLRQQREQRRIAELNLQVTREDIRPDLTLSAGYSLSGIGGNLFSRSGLGGDPELIERSGYGAALSALAGFDTPTFNVSLSLSYPVGMQAGRANWERARLQLRQTDLSLQSQELAISTEVTSAGLAVDNAFLQLEAARRSREAAERSAAAELTRFEVGVTTNFQVVAAQDALTSARLSELRAVIGYMNALSEFDRVRGAGYPF
jgi:outer membrane protein